MFLFENEKEVGDLFDTINNFSGESYSTDYSTLLDHEKYSESLGGYLSTKADDPLHYMALKIRRPYTPDGISELSHKFALIHMLELPFEELPLYLNSGYTVVSGSARWRLKIGR